MRKKLASNQILKYLETRLQKCWYNNMLPNKQSNEGI